MNRVAYMPLNTYPEAVSDDALRAGANLVAALGCNLHVSTFSVVIRQMVSPMGRFLLDVPDLIRKAEDTSKAECRRLEQLARDTAGSGVDTHCISHALSMGGALDYAAVEARYFDLSVLPWSADSMTAQDMAQAVVFGSGRPAILVPPGTVGGAQEHIAIAWDESRVAARALGDALPLLAAGGKVTVLTVKDEKDLRDTGLAQTLAAALQARGHAAEAVEVALDGRPIGQALQDAAMSSGAQILAMGGFGHSRMRDFILGGATKGIFGNLRMPVLLAH